MADNPGRKVTLPALASTAHTAKKLPKYGRATYQDDHLTETTNEKDTKARGRAEPQSKNRRERVQHSCFLRSLILLLV